MKCAIIGCGRIAVNHVKAVANNNLDLVALCDVDDSKFDIMLEKADCGDFSNAERYADYRQMLADHPEIELVAIATESGKHAEIALDCIDAGKNLIIEKPMAMSITDADEIIRRADEKGVKVSACHQNRFNVAIQQLREAVEANRFGKLSHGSIHVRWNRGKGYYDQAPWRGTWEQDGGTLMNQCIHNIDLLQWSLGGEPDTVMAMTGNFLRDIQAEDFGAILIRFKNGAIGIVEGTACVYPKNLEETLSIFGGTGTAVIGGLAVNRVQTWNFETPAPQDDEVAKINGTDPKDVYGSGHTPLYANYIHAIENGVDPLVSGTEAIKAMKIILAAYKSQKTGQPVKFDDLEFSTLDMQDSDVRWHRG